MTLLCGCLDISQSDAEILLLSSFIMHCNLSLLHWMDHHHSLTNINNTTTSDTHCTGDDHDALPPRLQQCRLFVYFIYILSFYLVLEIVTATGCKIPSQPISSVVPRANKFIPAHNILMILIDNSILRACVYWRQFMVLIHPVHTDEWCCACTPLLLFDWVGWTRLFTKYHDDNTTRQHAHELNPLYQIQYQWMNSISVISGW